MAGISIYDSPLAGAVGPGTKVSPYDVKPAERVLPSQATQPIAGLKIPTLPTVAPISNGQLAASVKTILAERPDQTSKPTVRLNEKTRELFVNGLQFNVDDADNALKSREYLAKPKAAAPKGEGWRKFSQQEYEQYLDKIENPTPGEIFGKNFRMGLSSYNETTGALKQWQAPYTNNLFGTEEQGAAQVAAAREQLRMRSPYTRKFGDIGKSADPVDAAVDWFAGVVGQAGPSLIESVATAMGGFAAGTSTAGPGGGVIGGAAGAVGSVFFKPAAKKMLFDALKKRSQGIALDVAEQKLVRTAAGLTGAAVVTGAVNLGQQTGTIYNEIRQGGASADDMQAREKALLYGVPASALENLTEFAFGLRVFGGANAVGQGFLKRLGIGLAIGGTAEGLTESGQEGLAIAASADANKKDIGKALLSDVGMARMMESFAAGFAVGAPFGGIANLASKQDPVDLANNAPVKNKLLEVEEARRTGRPPLTLPGDVLQITDGRQSLGPVNQGPDGPDGGSGARGLRTTSRDLERTYDEYSLADDAARIANRDLSPYVYDAEFGREQLANRDLIPTSRDLIPTYDEYSLVDNPAQLEQGTAQIGQDPAPLQLDYTGPAPTQYPEDGLPFGDDYNPRRSDVGPKRYSFTTRSGREVVQPTPFFPLDDDPTNVIQFAREVVDDSQPDIPPAVGVNRYEYLTNARNTLLDMLNKKYLSPDEREEAEFLLERVNLELDTPKMQDVAKRLGQSRGPEPERPSADILQFPKARLPYGKMKMVEPKPPRKALSKTEEMIQDYNDLMDARQDILGAIEASQYDPDFEGLDIDAAMDSLDSINDQLDTPEMLEAARIVEERLYAIPEVQNDNAPGKTKLQTTGKKRRASRKKGGTNAAQEPSTTAVAGTEQAGGTGTTATGSKRKRRNPTGARAAVKAQAKPITTTPGKTISTETPVQATVEEAAASAGVSLDPQTAPLGTPKSAGPMNAPTGVADPKAALRADIDAAKAAVKNGAANNLDTMEDVVVFSKGVKKLFDTILRFDDGDLLGTTVKFMESVVKEASVVLKGVLKAPKVADNVKQIARWNILAAGREYEQTHGSFPFPMENSNELWLAAYEGDDAPMRRRLEDGSDLDADTIRFTRQEVTDAVNETMDQWANKPKVTVYLDTGELRTQNRPLYDKIKRANPMFDRAGMVEQGVYVRSEGIILFSSSFTTKKEVAFVLAHETLGHYGLRAVLSDAELKAQLKYVYDNSPNIRAKADALAELYGNDPIRNTEEVLADMAGEVQPNIIARIWRALKTALGLDLGDEWARYMLSRARKYVVNGDYRVVSRGRLQGYKYQHDVDVVMSKRIMAGTPGSVLWEMNRNADQSRDYTNDVQGIRDRLNNTTARGAVGSTLRFLGRALEVVQTLDNKSARSEGLYVINDAFRLIVSRATTLKTKWRNMTGYTRATDGKYIYTDKVTGKRIKVDGPQAEDLKLADQLLANSALFLSKQGDAIAPAQYGDLFQMMPNGDIVENKDAIAKAKRVGIITPEQFSKGFEVFIGQDGDTRTAQFNVTAESPAYRVYKEQREAINDAAIERLRATLAGQAQVRAADYKKIGKMFRQMMPDMDTATREWMERVEQRYADMYYKDSTITEGVIITNRDRTKEADLWLKEVLRALHNADKRNDWFSPKKFAGDPKYEVADRYKDADNQFVIDGLRMFGNKTISRWAQYRISGIVRQQVLNTPILRNANLNAIKTIVTSYVPFNREGRYQLRIQAVDRQGNIVRLDPAFTSSLIFKQDNDQEFLMNFGREINDEFRGVYMMAPREILDPDAEPEMLEVELRAVVESSAGSPPLGDTVNLNDVVRALSMADVDLKPSDREKLILTLTRVGDRVRKASLRRVGLTGWDQDVIKGIETHLNTEAHIAAKDYYNHMVDNTMGDRTMWNGDREKLDSLKAAVDRQTNPNARDIAQREYDKYAVMYINSAPKVPGKPDMVELGGKMIETKGRGNEYLEAAKRLKQWYSQAGDLAISENDFISSTDFGTKVKSLTVASQLGGVVASAAVNIVSIYTHSIPYLSGYNPSTGRGGGFGATKSAIEINRALNQLKNPNFAEAEFLEAMVASRTWEQYGLTLDEALFLRNQTQEGILQAAQANALIGSARGGFKRNVGRAFEAWMFMFTYVEQLNRRTTALAAYRMYRDRAMAAGGSKADLVNDQSKLFKDLHDAGRDSVNFSQGDYAMYNRPELFRGNFLQYVFMYKMFVINTIQMMRNMPAKERFGVLLLLFIMSGLKGLPFADDLMDLIDTLARLFRIPIPSVEKAAAEFFNDVIPGSAPWFMRGGLDSLTGATFSTRFGMGDLIPLTGMLRPGADFQREFENLAGPVYGALMGYGRAGFELASGMPLTTVLRDSPLAAMRATLDSLVYMNDGNVTNAKGQVVSSDAGPGVIVWRALGFFPAESTVTNDTIRLGKYVDNYAKSIKATYVQKYILARNSKDSNRVADILRDVERWNRDAVGTGLEMKDFRKNAERSYKEASRPAGERYLRTTGKGVRSEIEQIQEMYGLTD